MTMKVCKEALATAQIFVLQKGLKLLSKKSSKLLLKKQIQDNNIVIMEGVNKNNH